MPVKRRSNKRREALTPSEDAWLRGDRDCGFVQFKRHEELQALWDAYGDHDAFVWEPPMCFPEPVTGHAGYRGQSGSVGT